MYMGIKRGLGRSEVKDCLLTNTAIKVEKEKTHEQKRVL